MTLASAVVNNPIEVCPLEEIANRILKSSDPFYTFVTRRSLFVAATNNNQNCAFYVVKLPMVSSNSFPLRKNSSRLREAFDSVSAIFMQFGLDRRLERIYNLDTDLCAFSTGGPKMNSFFGTLFTALIIYVTYLLVALGSLVGEILWTRLLVALGSLVEKILWTHRALK